MRRWGIVPALVLLGLVVGAGDPARAQRFPDSNLADDRIVIDGQHGNAIRRTPEITRDHGLSDAEWSARRIEAARALQERINHYEVGQGLGSADWRIGVLLSDLGHAFDTPGTQRQSTIAYENAVRTLRPYLGRDPKLDQAFLLAVDRLARASDRPGAAQGRVAELLNMVLDLPAPQGAPRLAERLIPLWRFRLGAEDLPGMNLVALRLRGRSGGPAPCSFRDFAQLVKEAEELRRRSGSAATRKASEAVELERETVLLGCESHNVDHPFEDRSDAAAAASPRAPVLASLVRSLGENGARERRVRLAEAYIEFKSVVDTSTPRSENGLSEGALAAIAEFGTLERFRAALILLKTQGRPSTFKGHPADLARSLAQGLSSDSPREAEIVFGKLPLLRPAKDGRPGWGSGTDLIAAARFHDAQGRRARATELARVALSSFGRQLGPTDWMRCHLILATDAGDDADPQQMADLMARAARDLAAVKDATALAEYGAALRRLPKSVEEMLDPAIAGTIGKILRNQITKEPSPIRAEAIQLAITAGIGLSRRDLFDAAIAASPHSTDLAGDFVPKLVAERDSRSRWFADLARRGKPMPAGPEAAPLLMAVLAAGDAAYVDRHLARAGALNAEPPRCDYYRLDALALAARSRLAGRSATRAEAERAVGGYEGSCGGNSWGAGQEPALREWLNDGLAWLGLDEPQIARRYLEVGVTNLVFGIGDKPPADLALSGDPDVPPRLAALARGRFLSGDAAAARELIERATTILSLRLRSAGAGAGRLREAARFRPVFDLHVEIAAASATARGDESPIARAFEATQLARATRTALSSAGLAARLATADPKLEALLKRRQDLTERIEQASRPVERDEGGARRIESSAMLQAYSDLQKVNDDLRRSNAKLAAAEDVEPLSLADARSRLAEDEALLVSHTTRDAVYVFAVTRTGANLVKARAGAGEVEELVTDVRSGLAIRDGALNRFPVEAAKDLYATLFAPILGRLPAVKILTIVADGALESLAIATLVTLRDGDRPRYLIEDFRLAQLPHVGALAIERRQDPSRAAGTFLGIGDPVLGPPLSGDATLKLAGLLTRSAPERVASLLKLRSLPETTVELTTMARLLGGRDEDIWTGPFATESRVRKADLGSFRTIAFATHAFLPGELAGAAEPGIVLTPPKVPVDGDDGLLTASEIATLRLSADLVILSACNTAGSDGRPGAEGLSGLARSFMIAGARTLIVSHWAVDSATTTKLMTSFAARLAADESPSAALRAAMLSVLAEAADTEPAHPSLWAPFFVIGGR